MAYLRKLNNCKKVLKAIKCPRFRSSVKESVFIWSIENFSMCCQKEDDVLSSPVFCLSECIPAKFSVNIYPKGKAGHEEYICVSFYRAPDAASDVIYVESWLSFVDADGQLCNIHESQNHLKNCEGWGFPTFIRREEVFKNESKFLPNDTLTLSWEVRVVVEHNESTETNVNQDEEEISVYENLSHDLKKLYESGEYSDLTLKLEDQELKLHKIILDARCSELKNIFEAERLKHGVNVDFTDLNPEAMKAFISYLYTGKVYSAAYVPLGLYEIACKYGPRELQHISKPNKVHARTKISVGSCSYTWVIENFSCWRHSISKKVLAASCLTEGKNFDVIFEPKGASGDDDEDQVSVFLFRPQCAKEEEAVRVKFKVSVVDINNKLQHTAIVNEMFGTGEKLGFCHFVKRDTLIKEKRNILPNDTLTLQCDISVSDGRVAISDLEEIFLTQTSAELSDNHLKKLAEDLEAFYKSEKLTDVSIRVKDKEFPVHKVILTTRSPVFRGMFSHEMAEEKTNVIEISDIDPDVIEIMLQYIYSGQLKKVNMYNALELYSASDKYQLLDMKAKCCTYISVSMTAENVCDVLILADMHSDNKLKLAAKKSFCSYACDILDTSEWKDILKNKVFLASEVLQFHDAYFRRNSKAIKRNKFH
ncbi:speckle-type POZ protein-like [Stegodyphus dumicola]|uniref:speckle-type POZ protein-like n=1 Tax=Stegodyphus dumicola TaxID=202533 RepID=UPI0015AC5955|nr:speckle-type POZ protein-like [Stegodyphus dumicola]